MSPSTESNANSNRFSGKVAIITGGGSGIGKASAILLAKQGAKVGILERHKRSAESAQKEIESFGGTAFAWETDISNPQSVESGVANIAAHFGGIDIVFANAGINGVLTSIEHMSAEDWSQTVDINLKGTFLTVKYAVPYLKEKGGSIIITSSINGNRVFSSFGFSAYSTTKGGQVAFMKMAALELAQYRIRVNAICPGTIHTNIDASTEKKPEVETISIPVVFPEGDQPLEKGPGSAEQVANLVAFLASQDSSHITGTEIYIDGAESLIRG
jgi:NAD(P)-dependent dehydrogenase (short-subunit alcohol dehydrogenase family)